MPGLLDKFMTLVASGRQPQQSGGLLGSQQGPMLAEALNPRLALARRMAEAEQGAPAMPDAAMPRMGRQWSPEEIARQRAALELILKHQGMNNGR